MSSVSRRYRPCCTIRRSPSVSVLDREGTHSPGLNPVLDCARTTAYVLYAIVFQETSVRHTRARTLFVLLAVPDLAVFLPPSPPRSRVLPFPPRGAPPRSHFAPGSCFSSRWQLLATLRANSRRYCLPLSPLSVGSILSRPPSFYSLDVSSREEKNSRGAASRSSGDRVAAPRSAIRKIDVRDVLG